MLKPGEMDAIYKCIRTRGSYRGVQKSQNKPTHGSAHSSWLMNPATSYLMEITNFKPQENIDKDIVQLFGPACYSVDIAL